MSVARDSTVTELFIIYLFLHILVLFKVKSFASCIIPLTFVYFVLLRPYACLSVQSHQLMTCIRIKMTSLLIISMINGLVLKLSINVHNMFPELNLMYTVYVCLFFHQSENCKLVTIYHDMKQRRAANLYM